MPRTPVTRNAACSFYNSARKAGRLQFLPIWEVVNLDAICRMEPDNK